MTSVLKAARPDCGRCYLVLDDLHTSDPSSLALLHFIARNLRGLRALIVGAYRPEEAQLVDRGGAGARRRGARGDVPAAGPAGARRRSPSWSRASRAARPIPSWSKSIERTTEGNPLFVDELLRLLVQRGDFAGATPGARCPVPDTVKEVIRKRARAPAAGDARAARRRVGHRPRLRRRDAGGAGQDAARRATAAALAPAEAANAVLPTEPGALPLLARAGGRDAVPGSAGRAARGAAPRAGGAARGARGRRAGRGGAPPAGGAAGRRRGGRGGRRAARGGAGDGDARVRGRGGDAGGRARAACRAPTPRSRARASSCAWARASRSCARARAIAGGRCAPRRPPRRGGSATASAWRGPALGYGAELMLAQNDRTLIDLLTEALAMLPPGPSGTRAQVMARLASARDARGRSEGPDADGARRAGDGARRRRG